MQENLSLYQSTKTFEIPSLYRMNFDVKGNEIIQLVRKAHCRDFHVQDFRSGSAIGYKLIEAGDNGETFLILEKGTDLPSQYSKVLFFKVGFRIEDDENEYSLTDTELSWVKNPEMEDDLDQARHAVILEDARKSWAGGFNFKSEDFDNDVLGLRPPQLGAIYSILSHFLVSTEPATIVMPTGTGKTETMLSVLVANQCNRVLVVVPTDALRQQISEKFISLGILKKLGVIEENVEYPVVGILNHQLDDVSAVEEIFLKCNVVVSTMSIVGKDNEEVQNKISELSSHVFIDEAHHLGATTWSRFKSRLKRSRILQFTATPFREDKKVVEGKPIFNYPLKLAQEEGYFRKIKFEPVREYDQRQKDKAIAEKAIAQLREDYDLGHIVMARTSTIPRAEEVYEVYSEYDEFNPVCIHTGLGVRERREVRRKILSLESRVVVCVDMLGEGFDLPELKIAAFHDIRKSLAVTLQLAGRFTRSREDLGDPTFIANIAEQDVKDEIRLLYKQDSDWNHLLSQSSENKTNKEFDLWQLLEGFQNFPKEIPLQNIRPALSAVVYRTNCDEWEPENISNGIRGYDSLERSYYDYNESEKYLIFVSTKKTGIPWADIEEIHTWDWEMNILFWDQEKQLLFINGSSNSGVYKGLAEAVAGEEVQLIRGGQVFRGFYNINRIKLQNVGLKEQLGRLISYTMKAGSDVEHGLSELDRRNVTKSNIFGSGYEDGQKVTMGCSYNGRVWSYKKGNLEEFISWCKNVGEKLVNSEIDPDEILKGTIESKQLSERPNLHPIAIEWPVAIFIEMEQSIFFKKGDDDEVPIYLSELSLIEESVDGDLKFILRGGAIESTFVLKIYEEGGAGTYSFSELDDEETLIFYKSNWLSLVEFMYEHPPKITFFDSSSLEGNTFSEVDKDYQPYDSNKIIEWDWEGTSIKKESQGTDRREDSIQFKVIEYLKAEEECQVIYNDDGPGEAADVIKIEVREERILIDFFHCKYSSEELPGARITDLYDVCGQAQKSIVWADKPQSLFEHILRRNASSNFQRFEKGNADELDKIYEMSREKPVFLKMTIVQPGLSKERVSNPQLELLSVTENYLWETYKIPLNIIASR